ncbi:hypothetical protein BC835DRAFT_1468555 [Cytidiella melzeri]|nr:hypothetical protein BC835DRAFT_1468555 [Cytidiella melzeri]
MHVSGSDVDMDVVEEDDVDEPQIAVEDEDEEDEEESDGKEDQLEDEDEEDEASNYSFRLIYDQTSDVDDIVQAGLTSVPLRLRIKLPPPGSAASSRIATGASTPEGPPRRRLIQRGSDAASENSDSEASDRSVSAGTTATPGRPLTARQAVLRNVVDSSHVSLEEPPNPRKKKPLTEIEMALKREETARKRKNLSEKKLEDEKAETINRLLKKQSRPRGKRNALATAEDRPTPVALVAEGEEGGEEASVAPVLPTMYRWTSTAKTITAASGEEERRLVMSFSVPVSVLPSSAELQPASGTVVDQTTNEGAKIAIQPPRPLQKCDVEGCKVYRKYRLAKDFQRGACGMAHLKQLEARLASV